MFLSTLKLANFKNYASADLAFDKKINLIYGLNGSGKTNLLDAIHFLSYSKSYFGMSDKGLVKENEGFFRLDGQFDIDGKNDHLEIKYKKEQSRIISINRKKLSRVNELIGRYPVVMIAPDDIKIVKGGSKDRRVFFNKWLCQSDASMLDQLMTYNRLLRQKDATLKADGHVQPLVIEALNHKIIPLASTIHHSIKEALQTFIPSFKDHYSAISGGADEVKIEYHSDLNDSDAKRLFDDHIYGEIKVKRPLVGVQRDDYIFSLGEQPLKKYGSQGQVKSVLYALRLSEFDYLRKALSILPILMLDDFFEKLDQNRMSSLLSLIESDSFGQVFLSDTELDRTQSILASRGINFGVYHVVKGRIHREA